MEADDALLQPWRSDPRGCGVFVDFDGTLADIVADPAAAAPVAGAVDVLVSLHEAGVRVAVVSGRPVAFLLGHVPATVPTFGLYGLERGIGGAPVSEPEAEQWRAVVDAVAARADRELPAGAGVEHKGLSLTLHVRQRPELTDVVETWALDTAAATGLVVRPAKRSVELHPPIAHDKGSVLDELLVGLRAACFVGDDVGDLPAFDALDRFAATGGHAVRVLVETDETVPALVARADVTVADPAAAVAFLRSLLA